MDRATFSRISTHGLVRVAVAVPRVRVADPRLNAEVQTIVAPQSCWRMHSLSSPTVLTGPAALRGANAHTRRSSSGNR